MTDVTQSFTYPFAASLAANLAAPMIQYCGRKIKKQLLGTEKEQAIERCINGSIIVLLSHSHYHTTDEQHLLEDIFNEFFKEKDTIKALSKLLESNSLDREELKEIFKDSGFDEKTLPGLDFDKAIAAFEIAFIELVDKEEELMPTIQTRHIRKQTQIQESILNEIRNLLSTLSKIEENTLKIGQNTIYGTSKDTSQPIEYRIQHIIEDPKEEIWYTHYLKTLIGYCDPLDLAAIDEFKSTGCLLPDESCISISDVFTTLFLEGVTRSEKESVSDVISGTRKKEKRHMGDKEEEQLPISAAEAAGAMPHLVILGKPGSGKSTLVNHLAVQLAKKQLHHPFNEKAIQGWDLAGNQLPVRIILRRFAAWLPEKVNHDKAGLVWDFIKKQLKDSGTEEVYESLKAHLLKKGGVIFFDGLDEVSESDEEKKRSIITSAIEQFARSAETIKIIITSREYAYTATDKWRLSEKLFPVVRLALFNMKQIGFFNDIWYAKVGEIKGWGDKKCKSEANDLTRAIDNRAYLFKLARYPLLLTLMASVHGSVGKIPEDRADLYQRCIDLLLSNWQRRIDQDIREGENQAGLLDQLDIPPSVLSDVLSKIAFNAHEKQEKDQSEGTADIAAHEIREHLKEEIGSYDKAENAITYIQQRAGLLVAKDNQIYQFPHRTFQEYLAAKYILRQSDPSGMLKERVKRDVIWWQEVFLLGAAILGKNTPFSIAALANTLLPNLPEATKISPLHFRLANLVATAFEDTRFKKDVEKEKDTEGSFHTIYQRILSWLLKGISATKELPPSDRAVAGQHLALIGDPREAVMTLEKMMFCHVPKGPFWMGSEDKDLGARENEKPIHFIKHLSYPFWISQFPVTHAQYEYFVREKGYSIESLWPEAEKAGYWKAGQFKGKWDKVRRSQPEKFGFPFDLSNHPVVGVSWYEALAFVRWLNDYGHERSFLPKRWSIVLPSEAEWEKSARGGITIPTSPVCTPFKLLSEAPSMKRGDEKNNKQPKRIYPWGENKNENYANYSDTEIRTSNCVGCFKDGISKYGCEEMSGSVWEWTRSLLKEDYPYVPGEERECLDADSDIARLLRGGSFEFDCYYARSTCRYYNDPDCMDNLIGFRVVVSPSSDPSGLWNSEM